MACGSCGNSAKNLIAVGKIQPNKLTWFLDGVSGLYKCATGKNTYSDDVIKKNRDVCRSCPHSTKNAKGNITVSSQCMAIDPETNAPCGCFILCKTQVGHCPLKLWNLTVEGKNATSTD